MLWLLLWWPLSLCLSDIWEVSWYEALQLSDRSLRDCLTIWYFTQQIQRKSRAFSCRASASNRTAAPGQMGPNWPMAAQSGKFLWWREIFHSNYVSDQILTPSLVKTRSSQASPVSSLQSITISEPNLCKVKTSLKVKWSVLKRSFIYWTFPEFYFDDNEAERGNPKSMRISLVKKGRNDRLRSLMTDCQTL